MAKKINNKRILNIDVEYVEIKPLIVVVANFKNYEAYYIFREDGTEHEVVLKDGKIANSTFGLLKNEIYYFNSGLYKNLNKYN